jgi:hypothetical protein
LKPSEAGQLFDPNAAESRKKQNLNETISISEKKQKKIKLDKNPNHWKYSRVNEQHDKIDREMLLNYNPRKSIEQTHGIEYEEKFRNLYHSRKFFSHHTKRSRVYKRSKYSHPILRKTATKSSNSSQTELKRSHVANSKFGLTVVLNPNEAEYGNALKNSYTGFKALVHTPYDFAEVFLRIGCEYFDLLYTRLLFVWCEKNFLE